MEIRRALRWVDSWWGISIFLGILAASLAGNLLVYAKLRSTGHAGGPPSLVGARLPSIRASTMDGLPVTTILNSAIPTVVYVYSPACGWCARNWPNVRTLVQKNRRKYEFVGLIYPIGGYREYVSRVSPGFSTFAGEEIGGLSFGTPRTLVVTPSGKIIRDWLGAYSGKTKAEIEKYFNTSLPGLLPVGAK